MKNMHFSVCVFYSHAHIHPYMFLHQ